MMATVSRLAKLRAMTVDEILARGRYSVFTAVERRRYRSQRLDSPERLRKELAHDLAQRGDWMPALLRRERGGSFFLPFADGDAARKWFHRAYAPETVKAREVAARAARHEIEFFGETFRFGERIPWHEDPVTRAEWPRSYHRDVPVGRRTFGDPKHVWELNRHQFFIDLAKVSMIDGDRSYQLALRQMLRDWRRQVPFATGAAWACALEPAFRAWSWIWAYHFLRAGGLLDDDLHIEWLAGFCEHGRFLHRHLETCTSPYNHLVGEASALFALGLLFPEFREAASWVRRGRHVLEATLSSQFHEDGGSVEQSTFYHHATLGFYVLSAVLGRRNGVDLSPEVWRSIERGIEFSIVLTQPDGRVPSIGGADDGKPIRLEHLPFWDFRPYYAIGAVLFNRGDFKFAATRFWEDAFWILGPEGHAAFDALPSKIASPSRILPASGYAVFRSEWSQTADYACFDCGPQAAGLRRDGVPSAAHGHADCLSVIASLGGRPVLVDPGFFCYNGEPEWEVHFRRTAAHNTISIDGRDQARHVSKMAWTHTYHARFEGESLDGAIGWVRGSHDGYAEGGRGVTHRRTVWLRHGHYLLIYDELAGQPGHLARANFQFAPGTLAVDSPGGALFDERFELAWCCSVPVSAAVVASGDDPSDGWIAPSLGVRRRAPRLSLDFTMSASTVCLLTILADRFAVNTRTARVSVASTVSHGAPILSATVEGDRWHDRVIANGGAHLASVDGIETDAPLAVVRMNASGVQEAHRTGGTVLNSAREHFTRPDAAAAGRR